MSSTEFNQASQSVTPVKRGFFNNAALFNEPDYDFRDPQMSEVKRYIPAMFSVPQNVAQHELAMETILRGNGFDPNRDRGWVEAGFSGRAEVVKILEERNLSNVVPSLEHFGEQIRYNQVEMPYDVQANPKSALHYAVDYLAKAYCERDTDAVHKDEAWEAAGLKGGLSGLRAKLHDMFVRARIGAQFTAENTDAVSRIAADVMLADTLPLAAKKLGIPEDIRNQLPQKPAMDGAQRAVERTPSFA